MRESNKHIGGKDSLIDISEENMDKKYYAKQIVMPRKIISGASLFVLYIITGSRKPY